MEKEIIEKIFNKKVKECMVYQSKLDPSKAVQAEFKAPKTVIRYLDKQKVRKTKPGVLDSFGVETSDRPHIERWIKPKYEIKRRTFEAKKYPVGSEKRKELNRNPLTSEYNPSEKYYLYIDGVFHDGYSTQDKAERAVEIIKEFKNPSIKLNWNLEKTDIGHFDSSIKHSTNPNRMHDCEIRWMSPDELIDLQSQALFKWQSNIGSGIKTGKELFYSGVNSERVEKFKEMLLDKNREWFAFPVEYEANGMVSDFQEGRHRVLALKELGLTEVPVWICRKRW